MGFINKTKMGKAPFWIFEIVPFVYRLVGFVSAWTQLIVSLDKSSYHMDKPQQTWTNIQF